jgi:antitoxin (DNA-binding transcriptional repressor) of toxin-antitoxin stability system
VAAAPTVDYLLAKEEPAARGKPVAKVVPLTRRIDRAGRGSLRGKLMAADDWDSDEVNEAIARDFGMMR